ncbi:hypothetical protein H0H81_002602 [Sphagnurus paluster]|uniref:Uncharacterized protein n=1 Tax=Sphagnurus paluster TaxID=117069 RepID=A0A9P7FNI6_9AGAR|nr:hypothetical protein H0H81_002602 [Sphagnurus paluster]
MSQIPSVIPVSPDGKPVAIVIDLSKDTKFWEHNKAESGDRSMASHIRSVIQDCFAGGSGSIASNKEETAAVFKSERAINALQGTCVKAPIITFYNECMTTPCTHINENGTACKGKAVLRKFDNTTPDPSGKEYFIGCSGWRGLKGSRSHWFMTIPSHIDQETLIKIFYNRGVLMGNNIASISQGCAVIRMPKSGAKGTGNCSYAHQSEDGTIIQAKIVKHSCPSCLKIFSPLNRKDHRAVLIATKPHNHPAPPHHKPSQEAKDLYTEAAMAIGPSGLTMCKCDTALRLPSAPLTKVIFGGKSIALVEPALSNQRRRQELLKAVKKKAAPHGTDLPGMAMTRNPHRLHSTEKNQVLCIKCNKSLLTQYIHKIVTKGDIKIIFTALPGLATLIHHAKYTLQDNTYKRVSGEFNEWEVVIWDDKSNQRKAYEFDSRVKQELLDTEKNFVLLNPCNTVQHCTHKNRLHAESRNHKAIERKEGVDEIVKEKGITNIRSLSKVAKGKTAAILKLAPPVANNDMEGVYPVASSTHSLSPVQRQSTPCQSTNTSPPLPITNCHSPASASKLTPAYPITVADPIPSTSDTRPFPASGPSALGKRLRKAPATLSEAATLSDILMDTGEESPERLKKRSCRHNTKRIKQLKSFENLQA